MISCYAIYAVLSVTALSSVEEPGLESMLDKDVTNHDDLFDAFRMSLQFWH
jgi:hypothetical protein